MTEPHDPDDLASAHLDGATSPEEAALVATDPDLQARVAELRAIREALGELPSVDLARKDAAIAAALAAFEEEAPPLRSAATVVPLASRRGLSPRAVRALGTAAVIALLALLVPLLAGLGGGDDDEASFDATGDAIEGGGADGGEATEEPANSSTTKDGASAPALYSGALGSYEDLDALAAAVADGRLAGRQTPGEDSVQSGTGDFCASSPPDQDTATGSATVAGREVVVLLHTGPDGTRTLTVLTADGCGLLDQREL